MPRTIQLAEADLWRRNLLLVHDLIKACNITEEETRKVISADDHTVSKKVELSDSQRDALKDVMQKKIDASTHIGVSELSGTNDIT